jgi:hypothetical protein
MNTQSKSFGNFRSEISIIELALANGYKQEKRKGNKWPVFVHAITNDRIIIVNPAIPANQGYWNPDNERDKGTLIHFVKNRLGILFPKDTTLSDVININNVLYSWLKMDRPQMDLSAYNTIIKKEFSPSCLEPLTNASYLYSRAITHETINSNSFKGRIYNVRINNFFNIAFPYYTTEDNKIEGIEIRNTNFKNHAEGSDRARAVWHSNMPERLMHIVLSESAVDALSYYQLKKPEHTLYISFGGAVTDRQIKTIKVLKEAGNVCNGFTYISAVDNDKNGEKYNRKFIELLDDGLIIDKPVLKDFNEDLMALPR